MRYNVLLEEKVNSRTREIMKQKEDKEILLKEIHHRVKNNMQVIVSLLNIHADYIKDPESLALLEDSKSRIKSMALIHEKLYETRNFARVNISEYLDSLVNDLVDTYGVDTEVVIDKKIEADSFGFDTIIPLGLLLNEIVSNSLKYAFQGRKEGKIHFYLQPEGKRFVLLIGDDGIGLARERYDNPGKTLGVDLIRILVEQLNGTIELLDGPGTNFRIVFESIDKRRI
jgi:two-component sensor histidine kinase